MQYKLQIQRDEIHEAVRARYAMVSTTASSRWTGPRACADRITSHLLTLVDAPDSNPVASAQGSRDGKRGNAVAIA